MCLKTRGGINDQSKVNAFQSMLTSVSAHEKYTYIFVDFLGTFFFSPSCEVFFVVKNAVSDLSKVKNLPHTETLNSIVRIWDQDFMTRSIMVDILFSCGVFFFLFTF